MGSRHSAHSIHWILYLVIVLFCSTTSTEAQTAVGFDFKQDYSLISLNVDNFTRSLEINIRTVFNFINASEVSLTKVTNNLYGKIRVNFTITIDTTINSKIIDRSHIEDSLRTENYLFVFESDNYEVNGSTVWIVNSFHDVWHQYAPEIVIAVLCGLVALAIFVASIHLICLNRKRPRRDMYAPRVSLAASNTATSLGQTNNGFLMDELNGGHRVHTPTSTVGSTRFTFDRNTFYDKLIYADYEVPPKHMFDFM